MSRAAISSANMQRSRTLIKSSSMRSATDMLKNEKVAWVTQRLRQLKSASIKTANGAACVMVKPAPKRNAPSNVAGTSLDTNRLKMTEWLPMRPASGESTTVRSGATTSGRPAFGGKNIITFNYCFQKSIAKKYKSQPKRLYQSKCHASTLARCPRRAPSQTESKSSSETTAAEFGES